MELATRTLGPVERPPSQNVEQLLNEEVARRQTFSGWTCTHCSPDQLARWGFYYFGVRDIVRCYICGLELTDWQPGDDAMQEHLRWSPNCPLMSYRTTDNVPIDENFLQQLPPLVPDQYGFGNGNAEERNSGTTNTGHPPETAPEQGETFEQRNQTHPTYALESARLNSYKYWPIQLKQTPQQLADAGFFYTGNNDTVECFSCGGVVRRWKEQDEPWTEHANLFPDCSYLILVKGLKFIHQCRKRAYAVDGRNVDSDKSQSAIGDSSSVTAELDVTDQNETDPDVTDPNETTRETSMCILCLSRPYDTVFLPCGHVNTCARCASSVSKCPMCNAEYDRIMRVYLA